MAIINTLTSIGSTRTLASAVRDYARPSKYRVVLGKSTFSKFIPANFDSDVAMAIQAINIPGSSFDVVDRHVGKPLLEKMPVNVTHDELTLTVQVSTNWSERDFFESWFHSIYDEETGQFGWKDDYVKDIKILQDNQARLTIAEYDAIECFPTNIGQIQLSYDAFDTIETFDVTLNYKRLERVKQTSVASVLGKLGIGFGL